MPFHPLSPRLFDLLANQRIVFERILCLRLLLRFRQLRRSGAESVSRWPKWGAGRVKFALAPMDLICGGGYVRTLLPLGSSAAFEHRLITFAPSKEIIFECRGKKATGPCHLPFPFSRGRLSRSQRPTLAATICHLAVVRGSCAIFENLIRAVK